jgi:hypothetical protein
LEAGSREAGEKLGIFEEVARGDGWDILEFSLLIY